MGDFDISIDPIWDEAQQRNIPTLNIVNRSEKDLDISMVLIVVKNVQEYNGEDNVLFSIKPHTLKPFENSEHDLTDELVKLKRKYHDSKKFLVTVDYKPHNHAVSKHYILSNF